jgi:hypothetical protein
VKKLLELGKKIPVGKIAKQLFSHKKGHNNNRGVGAVGTYNSTSGYSDQYNQGYYGKSVFVVEIF